MDLEQQYPSCARSSIRENLSTYYADLNQRKIEKSIHIPFNIRTKDIPFCNLIYDHYFDYALDEPHRSHGVAAVGHFLCQNILDSKLKGRTIEIGASPGIKSKATHSCHKLDGRDQGRLYKNTLYDHSIHENKICSMGAENCEFQADTIIANGVYDISHALLYEIMRKHQTTIAFFAMILPAGFAYNRFGWSLDGVYKTTRTGEDVHMTFRGGENGYSHDYKTWRDWVVHNAYIGKDFSIIFEKFKEVGPYTIVTATRCNLPTRIISPLVNDREDFVPIIDFTRVTKDTLNYIQTLHAKGHAEELIKDLPRLWLRKDIHSKVISNALTREDEHFRRQQIASNLKSYMNAIVIGSSEVQHGQMYDAHEFLVFSIVIYIQACIYRQVTTKTIGSSIEILKKNTNILEAVKNTFKYYANYSYENLTGNTKDNFDLLTNNGDNLATIVFLVERDMYVLTTTPAYETTKILDPELENEWEAYTREGLCANDTLDILKYGRIGHTHGEIDANDLLKHGITPNMVKITQDHVQPKITLQTHCQHAVAYVLDQPDQASYFNPIVSEIYNRYVSTPHPVKNASKCPTTFKAQAAYEIISADADNKQQMLDDLNFTGIYGKVNWLRYITNYKNITQIRKENPDYNAKHIFIACAPPGFDLKYWKQTDAIIYANALNRFDSHIVHCCNEANFVYTNRNIACEQCIPEAPYVYADIGSEGTNRQVVTTVSRVLDVLENKGKKYVVKMQRALQAFSESVPGTLRLYEQLKARKIYSFVNQNEIFITNMNTTLGLGLFKHVLENPNIIIREEEHGKEQDSDESDSDTVESNDDNMTSTDSDESVIFEDVKKVSFSLPDDFSELPVYHTNKKKRKPFVFPTESEAWTDQEIDYNKDLGFGDIQQTNIDYFGRSETSGMSIINQTTAIGVPFKLYYYDGNDYFEFDHFQVLEEAPTISDIITSEDIVISNQEDYYEKFYDFLNNYEINNPIYICIGDFKRKNPHIEISFIMNIAAGIAFKRNVELHFYQNKTTCQRCEAISFAHGDNPYESEGNLICNDKEYIMPQSRFTICRLDDEECSSLYSKAIKELSVNSEEFESINVKAVDYIKQLKIGPINKTIHGWVGCPGSGKSTTVKSTFKPTECVIITPYKRLCEEYKNAGYSSYTFIKAIPMHFGQKVIVIDEAFAISPGIFLCLINRKNKIFIVGDPRQMPNVDESNIYGGKKTRDLFNYSQLAQLSNSFTLPIDCTYWLNKQFGYDMTTSSRVIDSINVSKSEPSQDKVFCFTKAMEKRHANYTTVAKIQGIRTEITDLVVESNSHALIKSVPEQCVVAISRHSKKINIYQHARFDRLSNMPDIKKHTCKLHSPSKFYIGRIAYVFTRVSFNQYDMGTSQSINDKDLPVNNNIKKRAMRDKVQGLCRTYYTSNIEGHSEERTIEVGISEAAQNNFESFGYFPTDTNISPEKVIPDIREEEYTPEKIVFTTDNSEVSLDRVEEIMNKISPTTNRDNMYYGIHLSEFPEPKGKLVIKDPRKEAHLGKVHEYKNLRANTELRGRPCFANDANQTLHCIITRYMDHNKKMTRKEAHAEGSELFNKLKNTLVNVKPINIDDISMGTADYINKTMQKGDAFHSVQYDADNYSISKKIDFFLKQQTKADLKEDSWVRPSGESFKAGQGISAQPKAVNAIVAGAIRAFERNFKDSLPENIILPQGLSKEHLDKLVRGKFIDGTNGAEIDIDQFDSRRGEWTDYFMDLVYDHFGLDKAITDFMVLLNKDFIMDADFIKAKVKEHFQSGRCDTLISNTIVALAFILLYFKIKGLRLLLGQGDDIAILAELIEYVGKFGFFKILNEEYPSFVGFILADQLCVDLPRCVAKLNNRVFKDFKDHEEYRLGVKQWYSVIKNQDDYHLNTLINARKYKITAEEATYLLDYLILFSQKKVIKDLDSIELTYNTELQFDPYLEPRSIKNFNNYNRLLGAVSVKNISTIIAMGGSNKNVMKGTIIDFFMIHAAPIYEEYIKKKFADNGKIGKGICYALPLVELGLYIMPGGLLDQHGYSMTERIIIRIPALWMHYHVLKYPKLNDRICFHAWFNFFSRIATNFIRPGFI